MKTVINNENLAGASLIVGGLGTQDIIQLGFLVAALIQTLFIMVNFYHDWGDRKHERSERRRENELRKLKEEARLSKMEYYKNRHGT